jgi:acetylornithine deacetylase/succinyl-diaminopimelate desuccinylase-like protein
MTGSKLRAASMQAAHHHAYLENWPDAPKTVQVQRVPISTQQFDWIEKAWSYLDVQKAIDLDVALTNIYSPTGFEREVNTFIVDYWKKLGVDAFYQEMDPEQGNAIGRFKGSGDGPTILLCCPVDTHWKGSIKDDGLQWGDPMRRDNLRPAVVEGQTVIGLGSSNDKGMAVSIMMAVEALQRAGVPFRGTLNAAIFAGGAPAISADDEPRKNISLCAGALHALTRGITGDFCLYHKPAEGVSWEEPGMLYFRVRVKGDPSYMGAESNPRMPYRVIQDTARILQEIDQYMPAYSREYGAANFGPRISANGVRAGRPDKPNWSPAITEIFLDMRQGPWISPMEGKYIFDSFMSGVLRKYPGMQAEWEMYTAMPGGRTDPNNWIVQSAIRGAQKVSDDTSDVYETRGGGQTEAGVLRTWGLPTARIGGGNTSPELPADIARGFTMSGAYGPNLVRASKTMIYAIVDTLTRSREEVGLTY